MLMLEPAVGPAVGCPAQRAVSAVRYTKIEVVISGAIERAGRTRLDPDATVGTALAAAGGLAYRAHASPDGELGW